MQIARRTRTLNRRPQQSGVAARIAALAAALALLASAPAGADDQADFQYWLRGVRDEAIGIGLATATVDAALGQVTFSPRLSERSRTQAEFVKTFRQYVDTAISPRRIERGQALLRDHAGTFSKIEEVYGVPARYIVAIWGIESDYGQIQGSEPVVQALATRAFERRDSGRFRDQLIDALRIIDGNFIEPQQLVGSWAGAMGQPQFMPSAYLQYAQDFDGDQRWDIWQTPADVFASVAYFLSGHGWTRGESWGRQVLLPAQFDWSLADPDAKRPLSQWSQLGVRRVDGGALPVAEMDAALVLPDGHRGPAFLVYRNFGAILSYNNAIFYGLTIAQLADRFEGAAPIAWPSGEGPTPLTHEQISEIQRRLNAAGFDAGPADGIPGGKTRIALRTYQARYGLPADGHADGTIYAHIVRTLPPGQPG